MCNLQKNQNTKADIHISTYYCDETSSQLHSQCLGYVKISEVFRMFQEKLLITLHQMTHDLFFSMSVTWCHGCLLTTVWMLVDWSWFLLLHCQESSLPGEQLGLLHTGSWWDSYMGIIDLSSTESPADFCFRVKDR